MVYSFMPGQITNLTGQTAILFGICPMAACYFQLCTVSVRCRYNRHVVVLCGGLRTFVVCVNFVIMLACACICHFILVAHLVVIGFVQADAGIP